MLAVSTGMREGELLGLKWEDVDLEVGTLQIRRTLTRQGDRVSLEEPKTKKSRRTVNLVEAAMVALHGHLQRQMEEMQLLGDSHHGGTLVFANEVGGLVNPTNLRQRSLAALLKKARLPRMRFHDLRHTCATLLLSRGVHPKYVQELLGHATIAVTLDTYSHAVPGMGRATADAMQEALSRPATDPSRPAPPAR